MNIDDPVQAADLVRRIQADEAAAKGELFEAIKDKTRHHVLRQLQCPVAADDIISDTVQKGIKRLQRGDLKNPAALRFYLAQITRRLIFKEIRRRMNERNKYVSIQHVYDPSSLSNAAGTYPLGAVLIDERRNPEQQLSHNEQVAIKAEAMKAALKRLSKRDVEILTRFYLDEQGKDQIMRDMRLTDTQFRLFKWRAKSRLAADCQQILNPQSESIAA